MANEVGAAGGAAGGAAAAALYYYADGQRRESRLLAPVSNPIDREARRFDVGNRPLRALEADGRFYIRVCRRDRALRGGQWAHLCTATPLHCFLLLLRLHSGRPL